MDIECEFNKNECHLMMMESLWDEENLGLLCVIFAKFISKIAWGKSVKNVFFVWQIAQLIIVGLKFWFVKNFKSDWI